jgi:hypothetical protein
MLDIAAHRNVTPAVPAPDSSRDVGTSSATVSIACLRLSTDDRNFQPVESFNHLSPTHLQVERIQQIYMFQFPDIDSFT